MKLLRIVVMIVMAAGLSGCFKNEAEFNAFRVALKKRPDIQAEGLAACQSRVKYSHIELKRAVANYAHVKLDENLPATICRRFLSSYLSGRMKWADYEAIRGGNRQRITPNLARIMRGG